MSVINQMLKDLDERQGKKNNQSAFTETKKSHIPHNKKSLVYLIIPLIIFNFLGIYVWQLVSENSELKGDLAQLEKSTNIASVVSSNINNEQVDSIESSVSDENAPKVESALENKVNRREVDKNKLIDTAKNSQSHHYENQLDDNTVVEPLVPITNDNKHALNHGSETGHNNHSHPHIEEPTVRDINSLNTNGDAQKNKEKPTSSMTVSRKKLTTVQLVQHKLKAAEQALNSRQTNRAEELFEDVLLLDATHKSARQQLAALWFGRQSYQAATNLLAQGVAISPNDADFRLMKARIHIHINEQEQAYRTLLGLSEQQSTPSTIEYTSMLGNLAQQLGYHQQAVLSYLDLSILQPNVGRWWLGLGIAYDRLEQYENAVNAYKKAISQVDLSKNSADFALTRISVLGE